MPTSIRAPRIDPATTETLRGRSASEAEDGPSPASPWRYSETTTPVPLVVAVRSAPAVAAIATVRSRMSSGSAAARSRRTKSATSAAAPASASGNPEIAVMSRARPPVAAAAASRSSRRGAVRLSVSSRGVSASARIPIGTLMRNTQRQPSASAIRPPSRSPEAPPTAATPVHTAIARCRGRPFGKASTINASAAGAVRAAPRPWSARARTSVVALGASPHASDATVNTPRPSANTRRRP